MFNLQRRNFLLFSKEYKKYPGSPFENFTVNYYKCACCGFVSSKTHQKLNEVFWEELNASFHAFHEKKEIKKSIF